MAPQVGLEPTTLRLTAGCSAIELLRSVGALATTLRTHIIVMATRRSRQRSRARLQGSRRRGFAPLQDARLEPGTEMYTVVGYPFGKRIFHPVQQPVTILHIHVKNAI